MSTTIEASKEDILKLYKSSDKKAKQHMEKIYGREVFIGNITDHLKSFQDACKINKTTAAEVLPYHKPKNVKQVYLNTVAMLAEIAEALQENFEADYADSNQQKWYAWFEWDKRLSRFVFVLSDYRYTHTRAGSGSRFAFETEKKADYFGKQFIDLHNKALTY